MDLQFWLTGSQRSSLKLILFHITTIIHIQISAHTKFHIQGFILEHFSSHHTAVLGFQMHQKGRKQNYLSGHHSLKQTPSKLSQGFELGLNFKQHPGARTEAWQRFKTPAGTWTHSSVPGRPLTCNCEYKLHTSVLTSSLDSNSFFKYSHNQKRI